MLKKLTILTVVHLVAAITITITQHQPTVMLFQKVRTHRIPLAVHSQQVLHLAVLLSQCCLKFLLLKWLIQVTAITLNLAQALTGQEWLVRWHKAGQLGILVPTNVWVCLMVLLTSMPTMATHAGGCNNDSRHSFA